MATILRFDTARRTLAPRGGAHKGPAKILFFTGVRYERPLNQSLIEQKTARSKSRHGTASAGTLPDLTV